MFLDTGHPPGGPPAAFSVQRRVAASSPDLPIESLDRLASSDSFGLRSSARRPPGAASRPAARRIIPFSAGRESCGPPRQSCGRRTQSAHTRAPLPILIRYPASARMALPHDQGPRPLPPAEPSFSGPEGVRELSLDGHARLPRPRNSSHPAAVWTLVIVRCPKGDTVPGAVGGALRAVVDARLSIPVGPELRNEITDAFGQER